MLFLRVFYNFFFFFSKKWSLGHVGGMVFVSGHYDVFWCHTGRLKIVHFFTQVYYWGIPMCRPALSNYSPLAVETAVEAGLILLGQPFSCLIIYDWIFCMRPAASQIHFIMVLCLTFLLKRASNGSLAFSFKTGLAFKSKSYRGFSGFQPHNWGSASDHRSRGGAV